MIIESKTVDIIKCNHIALINHSHPVNSLAATKNALRISSHSSHLEILPFVFLLFEFVSYLLFHKLIIPLHQLLLIPCSHLILILKCQVRHGPRLQLLFPALLLSPLMIHSPLHLGPRLSACLLTLTVHECPGITCQVVHNRQAISFVGLQFRFIALGRLVDFLNLLVQLLKFLYFEIEAPHYIVHVEFGGLEVHRFLVNWLHRLGRLFLLGSLGSSLSVLSTHSIAEAEDHCSLHISKL